MTYLVVEAVGDGIRLDAAVSHFEEEFDSEHRLMVDAAQLQQHAIAHLSTHTQRHSEHRLMVNTTQLQQHAVAHLQTQPP